MTGMILGFVTQTINNWFDRFFLVLLLFHELTLNKKSKRILFIYFLVIEPVLAGATYLYEAIEPFRTGTVEVLLFLGMVLIPFLAVRKEVLRYEFCYALNYISVFFASFLILPVNMMFLHTEDVYFHVDKFSMLPGFFLFNIIYVIIFYIAYRVSKIVMKSYREESKFQNIFAVGILLFANVSVNIAFLQFYSESKWDRDISGLTAIFAVTAVVSMGTLLFVFYQGWQINKENRLIKRHREKELEYYTRLEKSQSTIRKLRHDILNYFQAVRQMNGDEERIRELLNELESRVQEK